MNTSSRILAVARGGLRVFQVLLVMGLIVAAAATLILAIRPDLFPSMYDNDPSSLQFLLPGLSIVLPEPVTTFLAPSFWAVTVGTRIPVVLVVLYITSQFKTIVDSISTGSPFTTSNAARIRNCGIAILVGAAVETASRSIWGFYVMNHVSVPGVTFNPRLSLATEATFAGLIVLIIAEVFRYGVLLQEEHDLTV